MRRITVSEAAEQTGWSPRMLRYVETAGLVVPERSESGYRLYSLRELNQLRSLAATPDGPSPAWVEWEQRKHERLLAA